MSIAGKSSPNIDEDVKEKCLDGEISTMKRFIKLVNSLDTVSNNLAEKALRQIRADILKHSACIKCLCDNKLFKNITKFLDFPNEKLLNLSISILATCCVQEEPRKQLKECNAVPQLASVLKNISQDGVQNRACRLVANLAQSKEVVHELHNHKVVEPIIKILTSNSSSGTQQSAIRALRLLWESMPLRDWNPCEAAQLASAAQVVAETLKSSHKDLTQCVLRALKSFTEGRASRLCVEKFSLSFYLALVSHLHDPLACQVAINIARVRIGLIMLNQCYALKPVIAILASCVFSSSSSSETPSASSSSSEAPPMSPPSTMTDSRHNYLLIILMCSLCAECTGRLQLLKIESGTAIFLYYLATEKNFRIRMQLFEILMHFTLEPATLKYLARNGLVPILVDKLEAYTMNHAKPHVKAEKLLCSATDLALEDLSSSQLSSASPVSESSAGASPSRVDYSPNLSPNLCASPSTSERSNSPLFAYSPVCSSSGIDSDGPEDSINDSCLDDYVNTQYQANPSLKKEDMQVAYFLEKLSHTVGTLDDLVSKKTIETIIKYKVLVNYASNRIITFLQTIAKKEQYYCQLLDQQFVLKLHRAWCRPSHSSCCSHCQSLYLAGERVLMTSSELSETGLGEGEMAHRLLTGRDDVKFQIALTVPLVLSDNKLLIRLLFKYNAYEILTRPLYDNTGTSAQLEDIAFSIKELFKTLGFTNPQIRSIETCRGCDILSLRRASSVTFLLDDGSLVPACKTVLSENSPVFEAMFRGGFRESEETQVRISDVTSVCLEHFVRLVDVYCECTLPTNVSTLLELVSVADRFLVAGLSGQALAHIMNSKLDYRSCQVIFKWAVESKLPLAKDISNEVIKYIFTAKMSRAQLRKALANMLEGVYKDKFLKDLSNMIKEALYKPDRIR